MAEESRSVDIREEIRNLARKYNEVARSTKLSKSSCRRLFCDCVMINSLMEQFKVFDVTLRVVNPYDYLDIYLPAKAQKNVEQIREVCEPAVQAYKDAGFSFYDDESKMKFKTFDSQVIIQDFITDCFPDQEQFMDHLYDNKCFLENPAFLTLNNAQGLAYMMPTIDEYRMFINDASLSTMGSMATFLHEYMHLYTAKKLYDEDWRKYFHYKIGYYMETPTLFMELCFYDFLKRCGIEELEIDKNLNRIDFTCLNAYKFLIYLSEMARRGHAIDWREDPIIIQGKVEDCDIDRGIPGFEYEKGINEIENSFIEYSVGSLAAYQMFERVKAGELPEKVLFDFFKSMDKDLRIRDVIHEDYNYGFIKQEVEGRMKVLKNGLSGGR